MKYQLTKSNEWNVLKIAAIISLIVCAINLVVVLAYPVFQYDELINNALGTVNNNGFIKQFWREFYGFVWQHQTNEGAAKNIVNKEISTSRFWGTAWLFFALIFNWIVFCWHYAKYVVAGAIYILLVVVYMIIPTDVFPDFLPLAGQVDDVLVDLFGMGLGLTSFVEAWKRNHVRKMLGQQREDIALDIICKEYGFEMQRVDSSNLMEDEQ